MNGRVRTFLSELNIRYPWLKLAGLFAAIFVVVFLVTLLVENIKYYGSKVMTVPMKYHEEVAPVPERDFSKKLVALTFDDGPNAETTNRLLDILKEKHVVATFFELGKSVRANPGVAQRVVEEGHELGSHTMYHQNLGKASASGILGDVNEAKQVFLDTVGFVPTITRPPYGSMNAALKDNAGTPLILWTVDPEDWKYRDAETVRWRTVPYVFDGAIILLHDIYDSSVDAASLIIDDLRAAGYEFVTVSELAGLRGVEMLAGQSYGSFKP